MQMIAIFFLYKSTILFDLFNGDLVLSAFSRGKVFTNFHLVSRWGKPKPEKENEKWKWKRIII